MSEQYSALAGIYDALMYDVSYDRWAEYLMDILNARGIRKGANLLEYACGTGNITLPLAENGFHMTAVDIAEDMLFVAQEKTRKKALKVSYACADMRGFLLNKKADAVVCACDGVNYLLEEDDMRDFFKGVYGNLKNGGAFLFDISSAYKIKEVLGDEFYYDDGDEQTYFWQNSYDKEKKTVTMELTMFLRQGEVYKRYDEMHKQRAWEQDELKELLCEAGFSQISQYGFMTCDVPHRQEDRIQFVAGKVQ